MSEQFSELLVRQARYLANGVTGIGHLFQQGEASDFGFGIEASFGGAAVRGNGAVTLFPGADENWGETRPTRGHLDGVNRFQLVQIFYGFFSTGK